MAVEYVPVDSISANDYNPNSQAPREFKMLKKSIKEDGFCVVPETPILCADLVWRPAGDLAAGDEIIALDEHADKSANRKHGRRFRTATVMSNGIKKDDLWCVETPKGTVRCNGDHPWLVRRWRGPTQLRTSGWVKTRNLVAELDSVVHIIEPWTTDTSWEAGWLAGMMDGEGSFAVNVNRKTKSAIHRLAIYQRPGPTADRLVEAVGRRSARHSVRVDPRQSSNPKWNDMLTVRVDALGEIMRLLGMVRPPRLLEVGNFWEGRSIATPDSAVPVLSVRPIGTGEIATLSTSTKTYIANGFAMHNTQPIVVHRESRQIVDGEHRWKAAKDLGMTEVPVVLVDMTKEQMRIATLRHNRARGTEDMELTAQVMRDLHELGAIDWAADSLELDKEDIDRLIGDFSAATEMAGADYGEAWVPKKETQPRETDGKDPGGGYIVDMTPKTVEKLKETEQRVEAAKDEREAERVTKEACVFRLSLTFAGDEARIVKTVLGVTPATKILEWAKRAMGEMMNQA